MIEKLMFKTMIICNNSIDLIFFVNQDGSISADRCQMTDGCINRSISQNFSRSNFLLVRKRNSYFTKPLDCLFTFFFKASAKEFR
jgi:hypothetical protein